MKTKFKLVDLPIEHRNQIYPRLIGEKRSGWGQIMCIDEANGVKDRRKALKIPCSKRTPLAMKNKHNYGRPSDHALWRSMIDTSPASKAAS